MTWKGSSVTHPVVCASAEGTGIAAGGDSRSERQDKQIARRGD